MRRKFCASFRVCTLIEFNRKPPLSTSAACWNAIHLRLGFFSVIDGYLGDGGLSLCQGAVVDLTLIHTLRSAKNVERNRDQEMHQTKQGSQYYFGAKAHIGVDNESDLVCSVAVMVANVPDVTEEDKLLGSYKYLICADASNTGVEKREEHAGVGVYGTAACENTGQIA